MLLNFGMWKLDEIWSATFRITSKPTQTDFAFLLIREFTYCTKLPKPSSRSATFRYARELVEILPKVSAVVRLNGLKEVLGDMPGCKGGTGLAVFVRDNNDELG